MAVLCGTPETEMATVNMPGARMLSKCKQDCCPVATLTFTDKKLLEELLGMGGGYVLDFRDSTYAAFFRDQGMDIYSDLYSINGNSKAKRMRAFWEVATDAQVGRVLDALFDYIVSTKPAGGGPVEDRHRAIAVRLSGKPAPASVASSEDDFLASQFGSLTIAGLPLDAAIADTIDQRLREIADCVRANASLACILLAGSTLEALLLNAATSSPANFNRAKAAPKDASGKTRPFPEWSLNDLINVAYEAGRIKLDVKQFSHSLRNFRNYIHPYEQAHSRFNPDSHTAQISLQVLRAAIADLSGQR
jgi:hypothetical protein